MTTVGVLVVEDHPITRIGLRQMLATSFDLRVVGEAATVAEAGQMAQVLQPDIVLLDMRLPDGDGLAVLDRLASCAPRARALILSSFAGEGILRAAAARGAWGHLPKDASPEEIEASIAAVRAGRRTFPPGLLEKRAEIPSLTPRERAVIRLLVDGLGNREIGRRLGVSEATARTHMQNLMEKFGVHSRARVAALAAELGLT